MGKKKGKGKKKKKNHEPTPEELAQLEEQKQRDDLDAQLNELNYQIKRESEAFNEYQQQREKLNYFWIVEKMTPPTWRSRDSRRSLTDSIFSGVCPKRSMHLENVPYS